MSSTIAYIIIGVSVLFILGIKFLSSPKTARIGNLVAAAGMLIALLSLHKPTGEHVWSQGWTFNYTLIAIGTVIGLDHRRDRRVFGEDDRDAADGRALQRPRRRRGGAGREPGISSAARTATEGITAFIAGSDAVRHAHRLALVFRQHHRVSETGGKI